MNQGLNEDKGLFTVRLNFQFCWCRTKIAKGLVIIVSLNFRARGSSLTSVVSLRQKKIHGNLYAPPTNIKLARVAS